MNQHETFTIANMDVTVEESADTLAYSFLPHGPVYRPKVPFGIVLIFVGGPLALLGLVGYAYVKAPANRPQWELVLTGVFAAQLLVWLVIGAIQTALMIRWSLRGIRTELRFTSAQVRHGADPICPLEEVRGLKLFTYTPTEGERKGQPEACLSLVIGAAGDTHGLFGGFEDQQLRKLADDLHRRLGAFRSNQGLIAPLEPLAVVATTEDEVDPLMHTRPPTTRSRRFVILNILALRNRWAGSAWCLAMLAGMFASARLIGAAGLNGLFLLGHGFVGFLHVALLVALWTPQEPHENEQKTT